MFWLKPPADQMNAVVDQALALWGFNGAKFKLIAARENAVYKISTDTVTYALRLHRQGYRTDAELRSELQWMHAVSDLAASMCQPRSQLRLPDVYCMSFDGVQVDVL